MNMNPYPVIYADFMRSSFISVSPSAKGAVEWTMALRSKDEPPFRPLAILVAERHFVVYSTKSAVASTLQGKRIWEKAIRAESPVAVVQDKVYFRKPEKVDELSQVFFDGREVPGKLKILEADQACQPLYIEPLAGQFLALCRCQPPPEQGPPMSVFYAKPYEAMDFTWVRNVPGAPRLLPLHIPELQRFVVFSEQDVIVCHSMTARPAGEEIARFVYPLKKVISCSADKSGLLYLAGEDGETRVLKALTLGGEEKWSWSRPYTPPPIGASAEIPPIVGAEGVVYVVLGSSVLGIKDGRLVREFEVKDAQVKGCSALADGSLLVAAGRILVLVDERGGERFRLDLGEEILTPPVVDLEGRIYVGLSNTVVKIR